MERLDVVDEYGELSRKTARLFAQMSTAVRADFYFKIDDDVGERKGGCMCGAGAQPEKQSGAAQQRHGSGALGELGWRGTVQESAA